MQDPADGGREEAVEGVDGDVLVLARNQRQAREDQDRHHHLGDFETALDRSVEEVAHHHVDEGQRHHREQQEPATEARAMSQARARRWRGPRLLSFIDGTASSRAGARCHGFRVIHRD